MTPVANPRAWPATIVMLTTGLTLALAWIGGVHGQSRGTAALDVFARAASIHEAEARPALALIERDWNNSYVSMLLELAEMSVAPPSKTPQVGVAPGGEPGNPDGSASRPISPSRERLVRFLERQTGQRFGFDFDRWHRWVWSRPPDLHPEYTLFKGLLYANIDPRMREFFPRGVPDEIRFEEVVWVVVCV
jgi:hypothetical protein